MCTCNFMGFVIAFEMQVIFVHFSIFYVLCNQIDHIIQWEVYRISLKNTETQPFSEYYNFAKLNVFHLIIVDYFFGV